MKYKAIMVGLLLVVAAAAATATTGFIDYETTSSPDWEDNAETNGGGDSSGSEFMLPVHIEKTDNGWVFKIHLSESLMNLISGGGEEIPDQQSDEKDVDESNDWDDSDEQNQDDSEQDEIENETGNETDDNITEDEDQDGQNDSEQNDSDEQDEEFNEDVTYNGEYRYCYEYNGDEDELYGQWRDGEISNLEFQFLTPGGEGTAALEYDSDACGEHVPDEEDDSSNDEDQDNDNSDDDSSGDNSDDNSDDDSDDDSGDDGSDDDGDQDNTDNETQIEERHVTPAPDPDYVGDDYISYPNPRDHYLHDQDIHREGSLKVCKIMLNQNGEVITGETVPDTQFSIDTNVSDGTEYDGSDLSPVTFTTPLNQVADLVGTSPDLIEGDGYLDAECAEFHDLPLNKTYSYSQETISGANADQVEVVGYQEFWSNQFEPLNAVEDYGTSSNSDGEITLSPGYNTRHAEVIVVNQISDGGSNDDSTDDDSDQSDSVEGDSWNAEISNVDAVCMSANQSEGVGDTDYSTEGEMEQASWTGYIQTPDPCYGASLTDVVETGDNSYRISIDTEETTEDGEYCTQCIGQLTYEGEFSAENGFELEVVHDGEQVDTLTHPDYEEENESEPEPPTGDVNVNVGEMYFQQSDGNLAEDVLEAEVGDEIVFFNEGNLPHNIQIDEYGFEEELAPGESATLTVDESAEDVLVNCSYHAMHEARLNVTSDDQDGGNGDGDGDNETGVTEEAANIPAPEEGDYWYEAGTSDWVSYINPRDEYRSDYVSGASGPGSGKACIVLLNENGEAITGKTVPNTEVRFPTGDDFLSWHPYANPITAEYPLEENYNRPFDSDQFGTTPDLPQGDGYMDSHCIEFHQLEDDATLKYGEADVVGEHSDDIEIVGYYDKINTWYSDVDPLEIASPYGATSSSDGEVQFSPGNTHGEFYVILQLDR